MFERKYLSFQCEFSPLDLIGFFTYFFALLKYRVTALNIFSMCRQMWTWILDPRLLQKEVPSKPPGVSS